MKGRIAAVAAVFLVCGFGLAQNKPWSAEYDKGVGTAMFQNVTLDQAWSAAVKTLMQHKYQVRSSEKESGTLRATRQELASYHHALNLFFETDGTSVKVTASCDPLIKGEGLDGLIQKSGQRKNHEKIERKFFEYLAAELYK
jgi:hypothetical protein